MCVQKYPASGINQNFQWCGAGFKQLPNGIGFGGAEGAGNAGGTSDWESVGGNPPIPLMEVSSYKNRFPHIIILDMTHG